MERLVNQCSLTNPMPELCELTDTQFDKLLDLRDELEKISGVDPDVLLDICTAIKSKGITVKEMVNFIKPLPRKVKPKAKPKLLCSMFIHCGHEMSGPKSLEIAATRALFDAGCPVTWRKPTFLTTVQEDVLKAAGIALPVVEAREIWRGCKGYRQKGLDICRAHAMQRMRKMRAAATLIQSYVRMWRKQKLVKGLLETFGHGLNRDVFQVVLSNVREGPPRKPSGWLDWCSVGPTCVQCRTYFKIQGYIK